MPILATYKFNGANVAVKVQLLPADCTMISRFSGKVTIEDFWQAYTEAYAVIAGWNSLLEIADFASISELSLTPRDLRDIARDSADWLGKHNLNARKVLIAPDDLSFGMARVYCAQASFSARETVNAVRSRAEAAAWLEMDLTRFEGWLDFT